MAMLGAHGENCDDATEEDDDFDGDDGNKGDEGWDEDQDE